MKDWLSIGEFSKQTGFSNKALRLYEEKALLVPHSKGENQYRYYHAEQIHQARKIQHYKDLGFSLEQIKIILQESNQSTLKELIEQRLSESIKSLHEVSKQVMDLKSVLTSLNDGTELTDHQKETVMDNILNVSVGNLKRRGIVPSPQNLGALSSEVSNLPPELKLVVPEIQKIVKFANEKNILLGPGRGSSSSSMILFGQGYTPFYPLNFGLIPEVFSRTISVWLEVEYSRHKEVGAMCDQVTAKTNFEVVAFRCPFLDILKQVQDETGVIHFDQFSDYDPMILEAPQRLGQRGLWDIDWSPDFHAFQQTTAEFREKFGVDQVGLMKWIEKNKILGPEDFMNISYLSYFGGQPRLDEYRNGVCPAHLPELKSTNGLLLYREQWLHLFMRMTGMDAYHSIPVFKAVAKKEEADPNYQFIHKIEDKEIKELLISRGPHMFLKSHMVGAWWKYKRSAVIKSLWPELYLSTIDQWEQRHGIVYQDFGYKLEDGSFYLKA